MPKARLRDSDGDYVKNFCDLQNTGDMGITCTDSGNEASKNRPGDIMSMSELFEAAGMPRTGGVAGVSSDLYLDRTEESADTLRYNGIVLLIIVDYAGTSVGEDTVKYSYHVKHVPVVEYKYEEVKDYSYTDSVTGVMMVRREVWNRHGVRIIVVHAGWMGKFSFVELLKTLVTGLALLALAGTLTDYVVMRLLPNADVYRRYKNVRTIDFSDLKPDTRELKDDKKLTWGGRHLTDEVFVYGELDKDEVCAFLGVFLIMTVCLLAVSLSAALKHNTLNPTECQCLRPGVLHYQLHFLFDDGVTPYYVIGYTLEPN